MSINGHPINQIMSSVDVNTELEFSVYKYRPQSILDDRKLFSVNSSELNEFWLSRQLDLLHRNEELAFHSKFKKGRRYYHIPMIDFNCSVDDLEVAKGMLFNLLPGDIYRSLSFYESGRSVHAYGSFPIAHSKWIEFMGRLLLANLPNKPSLIDTRWIGHRLVGGYSALRWSANSEYYLKVPHKIS